MVVVVTILILQIAIITCIYDVLNMYQECQTTHRIRPCSWNAPNNPKKHHYSHFTDELLRPWKFKWLAQHSGELVCPARAQDRFAIFTLPCYAPSFPDEETKIQRAPDDS